MRLILISFCFAFLAVGCSQKMRQTKRAASAEPIEEINYTNQETYNVSVGDTVQIYFETNSCCYICVANQDKYAHLLYIGEKMVKNDNDKEGLCAGCNSTLAQLFVAKSAGTDTVQIGIYLPANPCVEGSGELDSFIVNVTQ
jgi:hypothetical protein